MAQRIAQQHNVQSLGIDMDLAQDGCAASLKEQLDEAGIHIDFLVNNVGVGGTSEFVHSRRTATG